MDCPRCGFQQPDDKYCANCGLDVESFLARPKPFLLRLVQNPNLYAFLIGGILVFSAFYIFLHQRAVGRQMTFLLRSHFLLSKDASDPNEPGNETPARSQVAKTAATESNEIKADQEDAAHDVAPTYSQIEIGFFELSRENLSVLAGKITRDEGDWHVVNIDDAKTLESLKASARKLPGFHARDLQKETGETQLDGGDINPDLSAPYLVVGVDLHKNENLHWALDMQLPQASPNRAIAEEIVPAAATAAPNGGPSEGLQYITLEGRTHFTPASALLLVYDPNVRSYGNLERLNHSPLRILASDDFRMGDSALVVWVRLK